MIAEVRHSDINNEEVAIAEFWRNKEEVAISEFRRNNNKGLQFRISGAARAKTTSGSHYRIEFLNTARRWERRRAKEEMQRELEGFKAR